MSRLCSRLISENILRGEMPQPIPLGEEFNQADGIEHRDLQEPLDI